MSALPISRRGVLAGSAALTLAGCDPGPAPTPAPSLRSSPVERPHQVGVITTPPAATTFQAWDLRPSAAPGVLFGALATAVEAIAGRSTAVEVTVSVGAGFFAHPGVTAPKPRRLVTMGSFPNDVLDPAWCHGDVLIQTSAPDRAAVDTALSTLAAGVKPHLVSRWHKDGFRDPEPAAGDRSAMRDLFGFREGAANPDPHDPAAMAAHTWVGNDDGEPDWAVGGSYLAIRLIRLSDTLWDTETITRQETVIGRRKADGVPLGQDSETADFTYASDPDGQAIALNAHIRLANPRTPATERNRILRRGYNYRDTAAGRLGLIFACYQRDLDAGFITVQRRLTGQALDQYILPFGGGYYFTLPGTRYPLPGR